MPGMDGYEATAAIRALSFDWARQIPILAMTANAFEEDIKKSLACGMNDHLTKPVNFDLLFSKLHQFLSRCEEETPGASDSAQAGPGRFLPEGEGILDIERGLDRLRGNVKVYKTLLKSFVENSRMDELATQLAGGDIGSALKIAGAIRGMSANLALTAVHETVSALEQKLKADIGDRELLANCLEAFEDTRRVINLYLTRD